MISPHGANEIRPLYVDNANDREKLNELSANLPQMILNSAAAANAVMLGAGYFTPLNGFMNLAEAISVAESMQTTDGLFWPVPCLNRCNDISTIKDANQIALLDPNVPGNPVIAVQEIQAIETSTEVQIENMTNQVFGTSDTDHPGVSTLLLTGNI